jgi:hypothetical protein
VLLLCFVSLFISLFLFSYSTSLLRVQICVHNFFKSEWFIINFRLPVAPVCDKCFHTHRLWLSYYNVSVAS